MRCRECKKLALNKINYKVCLMKKMKYYLLGAVVFLSVNLFGQSKKEIIENNARIIDSLISVVSSLKQNEITLIDKTAILTNNLEEMKSELADNHLLKEKLESRVDSILSKQDQLNSNRIIYNRLWGRVFNLDFSLKDHSLIPEHNQNYEVYTHFFNNNIHLGSFDSQDTGKYLLDWNTLDHRSKSAFSKGPNGGGMKDLI